MSAIAIPYFGRIEDDPDLLQPENFQRFVYGTTGHSLIKSHSSPILIFVASEPTLGISQAQARLNEITGMDADWDALGSAPPNQESRNLALGILEASFLMGRERPSYVTASAEGGVGVIYRSDTRYAAVECLNSGEMYLLWYDEQGNPQSQQIENTPEGIATALGRVSALHADAG